MRFCNLTLPGGWQNWDINRRTSWLNNPMVKGVEIRHYVCILEIWCECLGQSQVSLKKSDSIKIGATLLKHGWKKAGVKPCGPYAMQRVYANPHVV